MKQVGERRGAQERGVRLVGRIGDEEHRQRVLAGAAAKRA
jgi:hypothetical protein